MKKLVPISLICLGAVGFSACSKYNDADLRGRTERIEHRLSEVETNLQSVRSLLKAQEAHAYITSFEPHSEGSGGYVITLSNGKTLKIFHGKNGQNGRDGENGKDGAPGRDGVDGKNGKDGTPGRDGVDGKNGKDGAPGRDGVDGKNGKDGASSTMQITAIEEQDSYVRFTLADGRQIELARRAEMSFAFAEDADYAVFPNKRYEIRYTTQGLTAQSSLKVLAQNGYRAKLLRQSDEGGIIEVVAPSQVVDSELIVLLSDGRGAVKMYAMAIYAGMLTTSSESYMVERAGTTLSIPISTNTDYEVEIPQNATWLRRAGEGARALTVRQETLRLVVDANTTPGLRSTVVKLKSNGVTLRAITIAQRGESNTHNIQPGSSLETTLGGHFPDELKLTGQLTPTDFQFLNNNSRKIRILDLSELDMTALPEGAFRDSYFEEVKLPKGLKVILSSLFYGSKIKRLSIPETVTKIEAFAFHGCRGLTGELHLPSGLTSLGGSTFSGCSGLTGELHLPSGLTSLGGSTFSGCSGLTGELHLPPALNSIGQAAFSGCSGLTGTLVIPASVVVIEYEAFEGAIGLSKLVIEGATRISSETFLKSNNEALPLEAVYSKSEEPKAINAQTFWKGEGYGPKPKLLYVPRGTKAKYEALAGWNVFQKIEEMDVEAMPK